MSRHDLLDQPFVLLQSQQATPQLALHFMLCNSDVLGGGRGSVQLRAYGIGLNVVVCSIGWPSLLKKALGSVSVVPAASTE